MRCHRDWISDSKRRMDAERVSPPSIRSRSRSTAGMRLRSRNAARNVTPPTKTKERMARLAALMIVASHLDLCDSPHAEEADRLERQPHADEQRSGRRLEEGGEIFRMEQLKHDGEGDRAQSDQNRAPPVLR